MQCRPVDCRHALSAAFREISLSQSMSQVLWDRGRVLELNFAKFMAKAFMAGVTDGVNSFLNCEICDEIWQESTIAVLEDIMPFWPDHQDELMNTLWVIQHEEIYAWIFSKIAKPIARYILSKPAWQQTVKLRHWALAHLTPGED